MHDPARMKNSRSSIVQIVQLLRFASLMLLLGSVASASAQTVRERLEKDPGFRVYPVVFGVHSHDQIETSSGSTGRGWDYKRGAEN